MLLRRILESAVCCTKNLPKKEMDCPYRSGYPQLAESLDLEPLTPE
jgi:hypothetical protein